MTRMQALKQEITIMPSQSYLAVSYGKYAGINSRNHTNAITECRWARWAPSSRSSLCQYSIGIQHDFNLWIKANPARSMCSLAYVMLSVDRCTHPCGSAGALAGGLQQCNTRTHTHTLGTRSKCSLPTIARTLRKRWSTCRWLATSPCEQLKRSTVMPASSRLPKLACVGPVGEQQWWGVKKGRGVCKYI